MIAREYGHQEIVCDDCEVNTKEIGHDFTASIAEARAEDWKIELVEGEWRHTCPDCNSSGSRLARQKALLGIK